MTVPYDTTAAARLEALEIRSAHLEDSVQKLSQELVIQQQLLERQLDRYRRLLDQLNSEPGGASATLEEIPPHY